MANFFKKLVSGLTKTRNNIVSNLNTIFNGFSSIDDDFYNIVKISWMDEGSGKAQTTQAFDQE